MCRYIFIAVKSWEQNTGVIVIFARTFSSNLFSMHKKEANLVARQKG